MGFRAWMQNGRGSRPRVVVFALLLGLAAVADAAAQVRVSLAWDRNVDGHTAGYRVFVRNTTVELGAIDVGLATTITLPLPPGAEYFVTVRAYTATGALGPASSEIEIDLANAPGAPTGFAASVSGTAASLRWSPPGSGGTPLGYRISVGTAPGASNLVAGLPVGNVHSVGGNLPAGRYYARVQALNLLGSGPPSQEISFQVGGGATVPASPTNLAVSWSGTVARLSWAPPAGTAPSGYVVEAGTSPGAANIGRLHVGGATSYTIDVPPGTYYVRVRAVNGAGVSNPSNELTLQGPGAPGAARNLVASGSGNTVSLRWSPPSGSATATSYVIEVGTGPGLSNLARANVGNATSFTSPVPPGTYYVRVRAVNARGVGAPSNEVVVRR